ncbi:hypothetical protein FA15DRAFT_673375 [Coprinopsis marcescibilis]|uniref:Uncharacterized protein n=1 Tax=Coprinopsis marcescibilis TaxID=230819 RepID=A0A5C3KXB4_COPMA|nr:hypothetical protein FA15DRAFT_673375 [Coprinopsis marcescibilis]
MSTGMVDVDISDSSVKYAPSNGWADEGFSAQQGNTTCKRATVPGAKATVSFTGSGITVYGTIPPLQFNDTAEVSTYTLDEDPSSEFQYQAEQDPTNIKHYVSFYQNLAIPYGNHTLTVKHVSGLFYLDYFQVSVQPPGESPGHFELGASSEGRTQPVKPGAIVGAVIGGLALIAAVIITLYYLYKRTEWWTLKNGKPYPKTGSNPTNSSQSDLHLTQNAQPQPSSQAPAPAPLIYVLSTSNATHGAPTMAQFHPVTLHPGSSHVPFGHSDMPYTAERRPHTPPDSHTHDHDEDWQPPAFMKSTLPDSVTQVPPEDQPTSQPPPYSISTDPGNS